jgi:uncharacterized membrane protein
MNKYPVPVKKVKFFSLRHEIDKLIFLSALFSLSLVVIRITHTGHITFLSLLWNLFLAWLPYWISGVVRTYHLDCRRGWIFWLMFLLWVLFIPNSFYILTDLFHLEDETNDFLVPLWYDLILIVSVAWNGMIMGILSIRQIEKMFFPEKFAKADWIFLFPVMFLNGLGVYIGRYLRYNSWDIFINPFDLVRDIGRMLFHPMRYHNAWGMIFCFSVLLIFIYGMLKKLSQHKAFVAA